MFKELRNEAKLTFSIRTVGPMLIKGRDQSGADPLVPDMAFIRTYRDGQMIPFLPGSSLKGVFRSRAELIIASLRNDKVPYNPLVVNKDLEKIMKNKNGRERYLNSHPAVKMFGTTYLAGRTAFADAFPLSGKPLIMGERNHVGIDRITGASHGGALYNPEIVEEGIFQAEIRLTNYALWQFRLLICIMADLHDGYLSLGAGTTRGYGRVEIADVQAEIRDCRSVAPKDMWHGYEENDSVMLPSECAFRRQPYYWQARLTSENWREFCPVDLAVGLGKYRNQENW